MTLIEAIAVIENSPDLLPETKDTAIAALIESVLADTGPAKTPPSQVHGGNDG